MVKLIFASAVFVGSFLLFLVQPMLAKSLLPHVGGAPNVWVSCMLFFQLVLLAGYAYAAIGSAYLRPKSQIILHLVLIIIVIAFLFPIGLKTPLDIENTQPEIWLLITLSASIGLPYFLLSSNSSLMQRWYSHTTNSSPYFLFSISNAGSLLGLLNYPFAIEWLLPTSKQMTFWSINFCVLTILMFFIAIKIAFNKKPTETIKTEKLGKNIPFKKALMIIMLGFVPSSLFLSSTLYMTSEVGSFPLLWTIPLTLYLLSFILVFSAKGEWWTKTAQKLTLPAVMLVLYSALTGFPSILITTLVAFFIIATSCHGRVATEKPESEYLTSYYFWLSVGGALGGLFNTVAPYIFNDVLEYYIVMFFALLAVPSTNSFKKLPLKKAIPTFAVLAAALFYLFQVNVEDAKNRATSEKILFKERNFFGVSVVMDMTEETKRIYKHGSTRHGHQSTVQEEKLSPSSYYVPIYALINKLSDDFFAKPFGVLGLGVGTVSCYGREGQQFDFFEIDQLVIDIARNPDLFTYVSNCPPDINIIKGDARLELAKQPDYKYNLIIADAFSSDSVPTHLLTKEAVGIYIKKLNPKTGIIVFNISNRYMDLDGVLAQIAEIYRFKPYLIDYKDNPNDNNDLASTWLIMAPSDSPWLEEIAKSGKLLNAQDYSTKVWTDDYSNIIPVLRNIRAISNFIGQSDNDS
jgi:hypothetical protein